MRKTALLSLFLVFVFALGFGSAEKTDAALYCDWTVKQVIGTNGCCTGKLKYLVYANVCGSEYDGTPCNCRWMCIPSRLCSPALPNPK